MQVSSNDLLVKKFKEKLNFELDQTIRKHASLFILCFKKVHSINLENIAERKILLTEFQKYLAKYFQDREDLFLATMLTNDWEESLLNYGIKKRN